MSMVVLDRSNRDNRSQPSAEKVGGFSFLAGSLGVIFVAHCTVTFTFAIDRP
jgi:hypothetical protein